jgi:hypothetical protein
MVMQLLAPDILEEARGLSIPVCVTAFVLGLLIWLLGWRGHRFWIVLVTTVCAGILGLYSGALHGTQPILAGILLAVAAGALALAMVRVVAFGAGGVAAILLAKAVAPTWDEPLIAFLIGGLIGLVLFRLWTMVLTSSAGTMLMAYAGLCLAAHFGKVDIVALAQKQTLMLNLICGGIALVGVLVQYLLGRRWAEERRRREYRDGLYAPRYGERSWWDWGQGTYRKAS